MLVHLSATDSCMHLRVVAVMSCTLPSHVLPLNFSNSQISVSVSDELCLSSIAVALPVLSGDSYSDECIWGQSQVLLLSLVVGGSSLWGELLFCPALSASSHCHCKLGKDDRVPEVLDVASRLVSIEAF
ncbi:hypothetical protein VNO80_22219 [Phaseolus coccineus]|uniref:Uncharacterized protein n=1 Tax=Phaseolus coccineus TaxID=3886 RepID=A0AAN9M592_PHACN